jgi:CRISPR system Cascade subunit CasC
MKNKRLYVDFHVIQTVPPSCVNRDDTGRPKTAMYGGANRARVSSQSWKHAMREMFKEIFSDGNLGFRTKHAVDLIVNSLKKINPEITDEDAQKKAVEALSNAGVKINEKKGNITGALFFISSVQAEELAKLIESGEKDKKAYKKALSDKPSVDIALFGRMVADDATLNVDAASQVAHSISTHAIQNEYDYFTAVDDCSAEDNAGAGHLGTMEFNSSTLYRYATVNVADLLNTIGEDTADAVKGFAEAFIYSMPTGKQNSYANKTLPDLVYVTIRNDQSVNLSGAFEKPVQSKDGYVDKSVTALFDYAKKIYENYCGEPVCGFVVGREFEPGTEKVNIKELLDKLYNYISDEVM